MSYNNEEFPQYVKTAGKITILTALVGLFVFMLAFVFDVGQQEFSKVSAQTTTAPTKLTVLNTPPSFTVNAYEVTESSTSTPTNSGDDIVWTALANDSNGAPYFLLVCSTNATPTANAAGGALGTAAPDCDAGATQWGVSASVASDSYATVTRATTELAPFNESNDWYAWVCDDDPTNPRCNATPVQGLSATNSSPFNVNKRPEFSDFSNDGPVDPGGVLTFFSTSSDPDSVDVDDNIFLIVCSSASYNTNTDSCTGDEIASTVLTNVLSDAEASYALAAIVQDDEYPAFGYIVDTHGHEASANPIQFNFDVNNVAPVVSGGDISLNNGADISLLEAGAETTGFTLDFTVRDANSCEVAGGGDEITGYNVSVFRSGVGTSTCDTTAANYDPNNCYPSGVGASVWNLSCAATTTCSGGATQDDIDYSCTFPLWFVADPTDAAGPNTPAALGAQNWTAAVSGVDDDSATGTLATTSSPVDLISLSALEMLSADIAYGGIEPGSDSGTLNATSTLRNIGNTGLDQEARGEDMCGTFSVGTPCVESSTSTIPADQQKFASSSLTYASGLSIVMSSSTDNEVELDVLKTTSTSTPQQGTTYWGIAVPASIQLAGSYTGLNTFTARTAEAIDWE